MFAAMNATVWVYVLYLPISIALTIWVARTLHKNGLVFLVDTFGGNEKLAASVNHLLVVGFYLINIGYVTLALRYGDKPNDLQSGFEFLSTKIGLVLLVLGGMHFFNLLVFSKARHHARLGQALPPVKPDMTIADAKPNEK
jgi:hypothetical protein